MLEEKQLKELKSRLEEAFSDYYEEAGGWEYRYHHLLRARRYAVKLMQSEELEDREFDSTVVEVAALFHDIGRKEDIDGDYLNPMETHEGHDETGAELVRAYVEEFVSEEQMQKIEKAVRNHHSEPELIETMIVQDADDLGKFSSIDLWRLIHYASDNERTMDETIRYFREKLEPENRELIERLNFQKTREVARERLDRYSEIIDSMDRESKGDDIL